MSEAIYKKSQVDWHASKWVRKMHPISRLCWDILISWVKVYGRAGVCSLPDTEEFLRFAWLDDHEEHYIAMIAAAEKDGAITITHGDNALLTLNNWRSYQSDPTAAERQSRFKSKQKDALNDEASGPTEESVEPKTVTDDNGGNALGNAVTTRGEERRGKENEGVITSQVPLGRNGAKKRKPPDRKTVPEIPEKTPEPVPEPEARRQDYRRDLEFPPTPVEPIVLNGETHAEAFERIRREKANSNGLKPVQEVPIVRS